MLIFLLIIIFSIPFTGIINRVKSILSGRKGPGILQPMMDIIRLFKKGSVYSNTGSLIFQIAPSIYLATVICSVLMIPFGTERAVISFNGDFVMFAYILALGKFFNIISALDTGNSFEGMGASREALISMLVEPSFFILIGSLSVLTGYTSFQQIFSQISVIIVIYPMITYPLLLLSSFVLFMIGLIENCRMPVDDPKTHLELTMIHEVMILDNSGFDLGIILYTGCLKFSMYAALVANLFISTYFSIYINILIFCGVQVLFAVLTGIVESFLAKYRMNHIPQIVFSLSSVALLIFIGAMLLLHKLN